MRRRDAALILVSHDIDTLVYMCDAVLILGGTVGQPSRMIARVDVPAGPHPRNPADLKSARFAEIRRLMVDTLYLGLPAS